MKKLMSLILSVAIISTSTASATQPKSKNQDGIIGTIVYENTIVNNTLAKTSSADDIELHTIVSFTKNVDGTVTYYEYTNRELVEYHTFVPGSGVISSTYLNNGSKITEKTVVNEPANTSFQYQLSIMDREVSTNNSASRMPPYESRINYTKTYSNINNPDSVRPLGYMHYNHIYTNTTYSISCEVKERGHQMEDYTFNKDTGGKISFWLSVIGAVFGLSGTSLLNAVAKKIVDKCITIGLLVLGFGTTYLAAGTKTIRCNWFEQELHGTPTAPSNTGKQIYLSGVYAVVNYADGNGPQVETEGFTVQDWGNIAMGRWMMYNVFNIDEHPWFTNTDP